MAAVPKPRVVRAAEASASSISVPPKVETAEEFSLVALATAMLSNSVLISVPLTILAGLPDGRESLAAKLVVLI